MMEDLPISYGLYKYMRIMIWITALKYVRVHSWFGDHSVSKLHPNKFGNLLTINSYFTKIKLHTRIIWKAVEMCRSDKLKEWKHVKHPP
jgi:hypothetical protein